MLKKKIHDEYTSVDSLVMKNVKGLVVQTLRVMLSTAHFVMVDYHPFSLIILKLIQCSLPVRILKSSNDQ